MKTYLLAWNPKITEWDDLDDEINTIKEKGFVEGRWSCGSTKRIKPGDYFFSIRLGKEPKGIFASGRIISDVYEDEHWNEERYLEGKKALYVDIVFDALINPEKQEILRLEELKNDFPDMNWTPQSSGIAIPDEIAQGVKKRWSELTKRVRREYKEIPEGDFNGGDIDMIDEIIGILEAKRQIILCGPPGTSKTWMAKKIIENLIEKEEYYKSDGNCKIEQFYLANIVWIPNWDHEPTKEELEFLRSFSGVSFVKEKGIPHEKINFDRSLIKDGYQYGYAFSGGLPRRERNNAMVFFWSRHPDGNKIVGIYGSTDIGDFGYDEKRDAIKNIRCPEELTVLFKKFIDHKSDRHGKSPRQATFSYLKKRNAKNIIEDAINANREYKEVINRLERIKELLSKNIKNYDNLVGDYQIIQFHPSYTYEDFVRGLVAIPRSEEEGGGVTFEAKDKIFAKMCKTALDHPDKRFVLIIDEINRADMSKVFGELIYGLEYRDTEIETPYEVDGSKTLKIPKNLYIIGTMNTADKSIAFLDYALRRRFAFYPLYPDENVINKYYGDNLPETKKMALNLFDRVSKCFNTASGRDIMVGHTYFMVGEKRDDGKIYEPYGDNELNDENRAIELLKKKFVFEVAPIIHEYIMAGEDGVKADEIENAYKNKNIVKELGKLFNTWSSGKEQETSEEVKSEEKQI